MNPQKQVNELLQKRMDRKAFLKHVGIGVLAMTGLTGALKLLQGGHKSTKGYGDNAYGGTARTAIVNQVKRNIS